MAPGVGVLVLLPERGVAEDERSHEDAASLMAAGSSLAESVVYTCDFDATQPGYSVNPALQVKAQEYVLFALGNYKEAASDMVATLVKNR